MDTTSIRMTGVLSGCTTGTALWIQSPHTAIRIGGDAVGDQPTYVGIRIQGSDDDGIQIDSVKDRGIYIDTAKVGLQTVNCDTGIIIKGTSLAGYFDGNVYTTGNVTLNNSVNDTTTVSGRLEGYTALFSGNGEFTENLKVGTSLQDTLDVYSKATMSYAQIDTTYLAIKTSFAGAISAYASCFVDTVGTDSLIIMIGATRRGINIE